MANRIRPVQQLVVMIIGFFSLLIGLRILLGGTEIGTANELRNSLVCEAARDGVVDLGTQAEGVITSELRIRNASGSSIEIATVRTDCRCSVAELSLLENRLSPGAGINIPFTWNTFGRSGESFSTLTFDFKIATELTPQSVKLRIRSDVVPRFSVSPSQLWLQPEKASNYRLSVASSLSKPFRIKQAYSTHRSLQTMIVGDEVEVSFELSMWRADTVSSPIVLEIVSEESSYIMKVPVRITNRERNL